MIARIPKLKRILIRLTGFAVVSSGLLLALLMPAPAAAGGTLHPTSASGFPSSVASYLGGCGSGPAYITWISAIFNPTNTSPTVSYGTSSISLQYNDAGAVCATTDQYVAAHSHIVSVSSSTPTGVGGGISGLAGTERQLTFSPNQHDPGFDALTPTGFTYAPPGGFTVSGWYTITASSWFVAWRQDNSFWCVPNGNQAWDWANDGGACSTLPDSVSIYINVPQPPGTIQGTKVHDAGNVAFANGQGNVYLNGGFANSGNPYSYPNIAAGSYTVSADTSVAGYSLIGYTLCYNSTGCHSNTPTAGTSVSVNVPAGGYADLWWHYRPPAPTCSISASPTSITSGNSSTLSWSATNATSATLAGTSAAVPSGSRIVTPGSTTTYTLSVTGAGGSGSCSVTVTVTTPAPTCSISASPSSISPGGSSTLSWSATNATSATLAGTSAAVPSGSRTVNPSSTTTYTLSVTGAGGSGSCSTTVTVTTPAPTCSISASPTMVTAGTPSTLSWSSTNNPTSGSLSSNPSGSYAAPALPSGSRSVSPSVTTTYTLSVSNSGGSGQCSTTVTVGGATPPVTCDSVPSMYAKTDGASGRSFTAYVGEQVSFSATGGTGTYTWTLTDGGTADSSNTANPFLAHFNAPMNITTSGYNIRVDSGSDYQFCTVYIEPLPIHSLSAGCASGNQYLITGTADNGDGTVVDVDIIDTVGKTVITLATGMPANQPVGGKSIGYSYSGPIADTVSSHTIKATAHASSDVTDTQTFTCPVISPTTPSQIFFPDYLGERPPLY